jgi:hypothetical protein
MELLEAVAPPTVDFDEAGCPFDHDSEDPPTVNNDLIGNGTTLRQRMKAGASTGTHGEYAARQTKVLNPKDIPASSIARGKTPIAISGVEGSYPLWCAAHHLVPGQESLKRSTLLPFMVKKEDSEPLKGKTFTKGVVWCDVGYDVNGTQNGMYLPGSYAVGGGRGGLNVWIKEGKDAGIASLMSSASAAWPDNDDDDDDDCEPDGAPDPKSNKLTGVLYEVSANNRKWQYIKQAVRLVPGQFHDRHEPYSNFVLEVLEKMASNFKHATKVNIMKGECKQCEKRRDKIKEMGIPTPMGLVGRLNHTSRRMAGFLGGSSWRANIYTSGWGLAFMRAAKRGAPEAL